MLSIVLCESQNENIFKSLSCLQTQWNDALEIAQHVFSCRWAPYNVPKTIMAASESLVAWWNDLYGQLIQLGWEKFEMIPFYTRPGRLVEHTDGGGQACWISQLDWINRASTNICSPSIIRLLFTLSFTLEIDTFQCNALSDQAWQPIYIAACIK